MRASDRGYPTLAERRNIGSAGRHDRGCIRGSAGVCRLSPPRVVCPDIVDLRGFGKRQCLEGLPPLRLGQSRDRTQPSLECSRIHSQPPYIRRAM